MYQHILLSRMGRMTGQEVRDLGYLAWKDPWAWMEPMKGKRWETLLQHEKAHYHHLASQPSVKHKIKTIHQEMVLTQQYLLWDGLSAAGGAVEIKFDPYDGMCWKWAWKKKWTAIEDFDIQGHLICYVVSDRVTYENELICQDMDGHIRWRKKNVSTNIAIVGSHCYYVKMESHFNATDLCVCHVETGKQEKSIYKEADPAYDIILIKAAHRTLYLQIKNTTHSRLYRIQELELVPLFKRAADHMPLGQSTEGDDCVLTRAHETDEWAAHGKPISTWILPKEEIEWVNLPLGHVLTLKEGSQTIWQCAPRRRPVALFHVKVGEIDIPTWSNWESSLMQTYLVKTPFEEPYMVDILHHHVAKRPRIHEIERPITLPELEVHRFHTVSKDGTHVPYVMVKQKGHKPKALFVYVYGAYGDSTPVSWPYQTWYPLLTRGWAIIYAMVRGGGDVDAAWAAAARRENRHVSVDDFEAVVRASQNKLRLGPERTVIYGRSAGGVPVGATLARFPHGELAGAAFTEVPYVDVLRTSTNPDLPLTVGEYEEFGNPREKIINFRELLAVSPINGLSAEGAPGVFVLSHVGLLDRQVYAYESFKWIQRLRGAMTPDQINHADPRGKYVTFERAEAHVYRPRRGPRFRAVDLAVLDTWAEGSLTI